MNPKERHNEHDQECESFEIAISAMLDGELTATEKDTLAQHLLRCDSCRLAARRFEKVNQAVFANALNSPNYPLPNKSIGFTERVPRKSRSLPRFVFTAVSATVSATVCGCILFFIFNRPQPVEAQTVTSDQVIEPLKELLAITEQQELDQALSLKSLEWELRHLRLQMAEVAEGPERQEFSSRVNDLFHRVVEQQFYTSLDSMQ